MRLESDAACHIWSIDLRAVDQTDVSMLSPDEHTRAERLKIPAARAKFVAGRISIRHILSQYITLPPRDIRFYYNPDGKPDLDAAKLHFNFSHSNHLALLAIARQPVGIDVEQVRPVDRQQLAASFLTPLERAGLAALTNQPEADQLHTFFRLWTAKEAVVKAIGGGFRLVKTFQLDVPAAANGALRILPGSDSTPFPWQLQPLTELPAGFMAALAGNIPTPILRFLNFS